MTQSEQQNVDTVAKLLNGFMTGNTDQVNTLVHDDFTDHFVPDGFKTKEGFKQTVKMAHEAFSQFDTLKLKPEIMFAQGDMVAMMDLGSGTRNGKSYQHVDIHIFKFKDGQLHEHWNSFNLPRQGEILMKFMKESN
jgi:ketosteroid isomerase-like protein